jgi:hypothetical protein
VSGAAVTVTPVVAPEDLTKTHGVPIGFGSTGEKAAAIPVLRNKANRATNKPAGVFLIFRFPIFPSFSINLNC